MPLLVDPDFDASRGQLWRAFSLGVTLFKQFCFSVGLVFLTKKERKRIPESNAPAWHANQLQLLQKKKKTENDKQIIDELS